MADNAAGVYQTYPTRDGFPDWYLPTIYSDGVASIVPGLLTTRFYLYRSDPEINGKQVAQNQVTAQVVMPSSAFIATAIFFERTLKDFASAGKEHADLIERVRTAMTSVGA